jgi:hypothetical protein
LKEYPFRSFYRRERCGSKGNIDEEKGDGRNEGKRISFPVRCIGWEDGRRENTYVMKEVRASA